MTIYFTAAISQNDLYGKNYQQIIQCLEKLGHKVIHEHITKTSLEDILGSSVEDRKAHYKKVMSWINKVDLVVAELSFPSTLNVGHEVSLALEKSKPVIGLYVPERDSAFFEGIQSDRFVYEEYDEENLERILQSAIQFAQDQSDTRFNFFVFPQHVAYLDEVSRKRKIPKSVYLRELIEQDKRKNKDYEAI